MAIFSVGAALRTFLDEKSPILVYFLHRLWSEQQRAVTYKELREAILNGEISPEWLEDWQQDYVNFVNTTLNPLWLEAIDNAAEQLDAWLKENRMTPIVDWYDPDFDGIKEWTRNHAAELVTNSTETQIEAVRAVVHRATALENMSVDELSRAIRPMVGLTKPQAVANMRYYEALIANGMSEKKALDLSIKYAAKQHRYRGYMISRTELAFAYNEGADIATRQAQELGLVGDVKKRWVTTGGNAVGVRRVKQKNGGYKYVEYDRRCKWCIALEGKEIGLDEKFIWNGKELDMPPAHPHCMCAIEYVETTPPIID